MRLAGLEHRCEARRFEADAADVEYDGALVAGPAMRNSPLSPVIT
jgi:hypothetical protein